MVQPLISGGLGALNIDISMDTGTSLKNITNWHLIIARVPIGLVIVDQFLIGGYNYQIFQK